MDKMGRTFATFEEAAEMLECSTRTVYNYVRKGKLRRAYENGKVVLHRDEIEQLAGDVDSHTPEKTDRTILELMARVRELEMQMAVFRKMNGIEPISPLRPTPEEALKLLENAKRYEESDAFSASEVLLWISLFNRMDEVTFDLIRKAGAPDTFWQSFLKLCIVLEEYVTNPKRCKDSRIWNQYGLDLMGCKKSLRSLALLWVEMGYGNASNSLRKALGVGKDDLAKRLAS